MLNNARTVQTIDAHFGGDTVRIVVPGLPSIPAAARCMRAPLAQ